MRDERTPKDVCGEARPLKAYFRNFTVLLFVLLFFVCLLLLLHFPFSLFFLEVGGGEGDNMVIVSSAIYWS